MPASRGLTCSPSRVMAALFGSRRLRIKDEAPIHGVFRGPPPPVPRDQRQFSHSPATSRMRDLANIDGETGQDQGRETGGPYLRRGEAQINLARMRVDKLVPCCILHLALSRLNCPRAAQDRGTGVSTEALTAVSRPRGTVAHRRPSASVSVRQLSRWRPSPPPSPSTRPLLAEGLSISCPSSPALVLGPAGASSSC